MASTSTPDPTSGWFSDDEFADIRQRLPMLYVEAIPVRTDGMGKITDVGLLLRVNTEGAITRTLVSGRVMFGESIRDALFRHIEKDLGPMAFPQLPISPIPAHVVEYFPFPDAPYHDLRQHAVALVFVVPVTGTCDPRQDALDFTWMTPAEATHDEVAKELEGGRGQVLVSALAQMGALG
jgi:ADP-ribose pyrophosphatase YjhB (NUDIX family)